MYGCSPSDTWIERQPVFFVATAPLAADGLVNLSPKGTIGTFRVADAHTFSYLDITGSGIETVAHHYEAFDGVSPITHTSSGS